MSVLERKGLISYAASWGRERWAGGHGGSITGQVFLVAGENGSKKMLTIDRDRALDPGRYTCSSRDPTLC